MMEDAVDPEKLFHLLIGTPDEDNCPICRAHAQAEVDPAIGEGNVPIQVQELHLSEVLRCPCPLCREARETSL